MKKLLILFISLTSMFTFAQDPMLQQNKEQLDDEATKITQAYNDQLALRDKQFMLFQRKVEEFLIRRNKIEDQYEGKEQLNLLFNLQTTETGEMRNILTGPQFDLYKKIKPKIQPLATAEKQ
ncbi:hypothetical protein [Psychroserpens sp. Hel_I_66]|uniref:hypothetical protein n=1 Tax=Psychroserpens sp. Hel_I_66 TaxID=1250004 RepID=UPI000A9B2808|nr:hypothetical protein [Psychroserpens sp. Hel_I_66]